MNYEVQPSRTTPDEWAVEAIDYESDGEIYAALFSGPGAKERAEEYAAWKTWRDLADDGCDAAHPYAATHGVGALDLLRGIDTPEACLMRWRLEPFT